MDSQITFRGIAPIYSPLSLHLGVDQFSTTFIDSLKSINLQHSIDRDGQKADLKWRGKFSYLGGQEKEKRQYQSSAKNSKDVQLMCWSPFNNNDVVFHVFTNHIAIVEVDLAIDIEDFEVISNFKVVENIEEQVQLLVNEHKERYIQDFIEDLKQLRLYLSSDFIFSPVKMLKNNGWVSRAILLNDEQLSQNTIKQFLKSWLKETGRPQDAVDIISGEKTYSLTWLNYAVKDAKGVGKDTNIQMMVLAQYYYVAQENSNSALRSAIEAAYAKEKQTHQSKTLANTRTACRLNRIAFFEHIKFLSRHNRELLRDILAGWEFDKLIDNSERMIEICDSKLQEEDNKKRERSTVMTDFLLVTLSFFTVFELSLYLTEFSREMMSRPALDYNDSKSSLFLGVIARIDADIMFSFGFGLTLILILVYRYIKRN